MTLVVISHDHGGGYLVAYHDGGLPAYRVEWYPTLDEALASVDGARWRAPDADADGDVIAVCEY